MSIYQYNLNALIGIVAIYVGFPSILFLITREWFPWPGRRSPDAQKQVTSNNGHV